MDCLNGVRSAVMGIALFRDAAPLHVTVTIRSLSGKCWTLELPVTATGREIKSRMRHIAPEAEQQLSSGVEIISDDMQPLRSTSSLYLTRVPGAGALDTHRTLPRVLRARRFGAGHVRHGRLGSVRLVGQTIQDRTRG
ncbi:unnamed protein product [Durusdinium trenchii]|uniref:Ubiquitin-like domain-containing protein n=2 Tax=Durusdinium trenchii TaxID=1381693 RepID=A0ABP0I3S1_9DINO